MKVKCIDGDFSRSENELVKIILYIGDDYLLPKEGQEYEVIGYANFSNGIEAYELAEIDTTEHGYDKKLVFAKRRFIISDDKFIPNALTDDYGLGKMLCRKISFYLDLNHFIDHQK